MELVDIGKMVATVEVKIGPQFLNLFSENLYSSPNKAFEELVSNSWDAGARHVHIGVPDDLAAERAAIWVLDDGGSMDVAGFTALWSVATSQKRFAEVGNSRKQIGKFGVGKLATYLLAHELTYVCKAADGKVRAITMDYRRIDDSEKGALHIEPLPLQVREIGGNELAELLKGLPDKKRLLDLIAASLFVDDSADDDEDEFGGPDHEPPPASGTWTLAVLSSLKPQGRQLKVGWIRRLLRSALPLGRTIRIYFNDEPLSSSKSSIDIATEWVLGEGLGIASLKLSDGTEAAVTEHRSPYPHLMIEGIGEVTGRVRLYGDKISGGKSDNLDLSNGFFVNIRGRVLKPEDPYFGLINLSHSAWARFRGTVRADGLDEKLAVNREAVADGKTLDLFRALLMKLFNKVRGEYDATVAGSWPDAGSVLTEKWGTLPFEPLRRVIEERAASANAPAFIVLPPEDGRGASIEMWKKDVDAAPGEMIRDVVIADLRSEDALSHYDLGTRTVVVNKNHPFAVEHQETSQQMRVLRDTAIVELLTDAFMIDIGLTDDQVLEIRTYRDRAFRLVAQVRRRSAAQIAKLLLESVNHVKGFERIVGDALEYIGFEVQRYGQPGEPEGLATAVIPRADGDAKVAYSFTYDAKSVEPGKGSKAKAVQTGNVHVAGLARHRDDYSAAHSLVVGPKFQTGALEIECKSAGVTPMLASDLARLVLLTVGYGPISLIKFKELFNISGPDAVKAWVDKLIAEQQETPHLSLGTLIQALTVLAEKNADRPDMLTCPLIAEQCRELLGKNDFPQRGDVQKAINGLALMAPNVVSINGWDVMLSAPAAKIADLIAVQIGTIPDSYRYGIARGIAL